MVSANRGFEQLAPGDISKESLSKEQELTFLTTCEYIFFDDPQKITKNFI